MTPTKRFLLGFFGVAIAGWLAGVFLYGPPGMSAAYLDAFGEEHEHYVEVLKSDVYKLWAERPHLHGPETWSDPHEAAFLQEAIGFVERYEARPEFHAERERIHRYELFFEFFNPLLVVVLAWRFGRKPLLAFLDGQIAAVRTRIEEAESARAEAKARMDAAARQMASLADERKRLAEETEARIARELADTEAANQASREAMERELEDRKLGERLAAERRLKTELVDAAIAHLTHTIQSQSDPESQRRLVSDFLVELERRA